MSIMVIKHDGSKEPLNWDKATDSLKWATAGLENVSISDIEMQSKLHVYDGIPTSFILDVFIKTTYDMSSLRYINYDAVSRNLKLQKLYKQVFQSTKPPSLHDFIKNSKNKYADCIYDYSYEQLTHLEMVIDHSRDFSFTASGIDACLSELMKVNKIPSETPQFMYMLIAMDAFNGNLDRVIDLYEALSTFKITLPSPEMKAFRTNSTDYASCCTVRMGDTIDSWCEADSAIVKHTVASAGVGVSISDIASVGDKVKNGSISHSGKIPIIKSIDALIAKASQDGRRGSGTAFYNFFDPEVEDIMALKSPRTALDKRVNDLSYGICMHQLVYDRAVLGLPITLLSTRQAPELVDAIASKDPQYFIDIYEQAEARFTDAPKLDARDYFKSIGTERFENSAYYLVNIDEANYNTPYLNEIVQSNICVEFLVPTLALDSSKPHDPAIGICVLTNLNQALVPVKDLPHYTALVVELQSLASIKQNHPTTQANAFVDGYHDIGIGFSNHAYWLAKNGWKYGQQEAMDAHAEWMEHFCFGLIQASVNLAKVHGPAPLFHLTNWKDTPVMARQNPAAAALPVHRSVINPGQWVALQMDIKEYGMFNCGLSMNPPAETSSIKSNQTSGLEPIRDLLTIKDKQGFNHKQYAPEAIKLADKYDFAYDRNLNKDYLKHVAISQLWMDKGLSANTWYNPEAYENGKVPIEDIISDIYFFKKLGGKTMYYQNTSVPDGEDEIQQNSCSGGGCDV